MKHISRAIAGGLVLACHAAAWAQVPPPPAPAPPRGEYAPPARGYAPPFRGDAPPPRGYGPSPARPPYAPQPFPGAATEPPPAPYFEHRSFDDLQRPRRIQDFSYIYVEAPPPREIKEHDIITIVVAEKSSTTMNSIYNRQKNATYKAQLKEFVRLGKTGNLANAAENEPTIDSTLQGRVQSSGQMNDTEGITFRIAAEVVSVLPNGLLVLEARETVRSNRELWDYTLTGKISSRDVARDYTASSEKIANLEIKKTLKGKVYDSTNRPWGTRLWDKLFPF